MPEVNRGHKQRENSGDGWLNSKGQYVRYPEDTQVMI